MGVFDAPAVERAVKEAEAYAARQNRSADAPTVSPPPDWRKSLRFPYCPLCYEGWQSAQHAALEHFTFLSRVRCGGKATQQQQHQHHAGGAGGGVDHSAAGATGGRKAAAGGGPINGSAIGSALSAVSQHLGVASGGASSSTAVGEKDLWAEECLGPYRFHLWDFDALDRGRWSINWCDPRRISTALRTCRRTTN